VIASKKRDIKCDGGEKELRRQSDWSNATTENRRLNSTLPRDLAYLNAKFVDSHPHWLLTGELQWVVCGPVPSLNLSRCC